MLFIFVSFLSLKLSTNYPISKYLLNQCFVNHPWLIADQNRKAAIAAAWLPFLFISNELKQACMSGH